MTDTEKAAVLRAEEREIEASRRAEAMVTAAELTGKLAASEALEIRFALANGRSAVRDRQVLRDSLERMKSATTH